MSENKARGRQTARRIHAAHLVALALGSLCAAPAASATTIRLSDPDGGQSRLTVDGEEVATIVRAGDSKAIALAGSTIALHRDERPITPGARWPQRIVTTLREEPGGAAFREEHTLLAPPSPIEIEGYGLEVSWDEPDQNTAEQALLEEWLVANDGSRDLTTFRNLHATDSGRELVVWYEIAGRRVNGAVFDDSTGAGARAAGNAAADATETPLATYDSLWHREGEGWKIHHTREVFYHRQNLEGVDALAGPDGEDPMYAYHCGCYGWAIGADWMTLGDALYHAKVEWKHHRVGAGFFLGLIPTDSFPWLGWVDRERVGLLSRRVGAYELRDAAGEIFAEIPLTLPSDPPADGLGPINYEFRVSDEGGSLQPIARGRRDGIALELELPDDRDPGETLTLLDEMLAAMPTQVQRGHGVRDSHLAEFEEVIDILRVSQSSDASVRADLVSDIDAVSARTKTRALLSRFGAERFVPGEDTHVPLAPARDPASPFNATGRAAP